MKLICERDTLSSALSHVASRARNKLKIPILQHVLLDAGTNKLSLTATDMDTRSVATCPSEVSRSGATTVSADGLARLVTGLPAGAQISLEIKGNDLHVECGKSRYKLPTLPAADFPEMSGVENGIELSLKAADAKRLFGEPAPAVSNEASRFYLCGGHLSQREKGRIRLTATNGISLVRFAIANEATLERDYIIPKPAMAEIVKLAALGEIVLRINDNLVEVEAGSVLFTSKLINATYPDADRIIPKVEDCCVEVDRAEFVAAFKRLIGIEDENSTVDIRWKASEAALEMSLAGNGSGSESVACKCDLADGGISFKPNVLGGMLDVFGGEAIQLHVSEPNAPMLIVDPADPGLTVLAMPCKGGG